MINATTKIFQNIDTLKRYSKDTAPHRIIFNVPIIGRPCSVCGKGRPPLPYTIIDADYKPICGKCALEKNIPIASVWDSYERLIDIPVLRLERDQDFPITYLVEFGVPKGFEYNRIEIEWLARIIGAKAAAFSMDLIYYYGDVGRIKPVLNIGIREMHGGRELIERAEKEIMEKIEEVRELMVRNKVMFFCMACVQEQPDEIPI